ncbi:MAG: hypothetical protein HC897_11115 [Thermoanaerobaculia bacterium]|nr:hypothetical protein [Thermoanaerobaculia bacterium]
MASAIFRNASVVFVDASGQPTATYLEGGRAYVRVVAGLANVDTQVAETLEISVFALNSTDSESLTLVETGPDTSVFEGSIELPVGYSTLDGRLQVTQLPGGAYETIRATVWQWDQNTTTSATVLGSRTWLGDATGTPIDSFAIGQAVWVWVEDHAADVTSQSDTTTVTVATFGAGDGETLELVETGPSTGIFAGSIVLRFGLASPGDGQLEAQLPDTLEAIHLEALGYTDSRDEAQVSTR